MGPILVLLLLLAAAVGYLYVRVSRLEQQLVDRRRPVRGPRSNSKVIPILKENIEPGPFRKGNQLRGSKESDE